MAPSVGVWHDAQGSSNPYYLESTERRATEPGIDLQEEDDRQSSNPSSTSELCDVGPVLESEMLNGIHSTTLYREISMDHVGFEEEGMSEAGTYYVGDVLLHAIAAESARPPPPFEWVELGEVYRDADYVDSLEDRKMVGLQPNPSASRGGYRGRGGRGRSGGRGAAASVASRSGP